MGKRHKVHSFSADICVVYGSHITGYMYGLE
nr:MAG TPA: hypothetical protein [Caudoviricetes sp.]DAW03436.1 MAG TPA: hypothetical protein [Caudoviricetes sp.]